jgi:predicted transcriptional regulator
MRKTITVLSLVFMLAGCVKDPYRAAIQGSADVSQAVSSGIKITASYYSAGQFNDAQKATAAKYFTIVTDCNLSFRKAVVDVHNAGQTGAQAFLPIADSFVACVKASAPVTADPKVISVLNAVDTAIKGVEVAIASAKGGTK